MGKGLAEFGKKVTKGEFKGEFERAGKSLGKGSSELGKGVGKGSGKGLKKIGKGIGGLASKVDREAGNDKQKESESKSLAKPESANKYQWPQGWTCGKQG
jgi:hypothetical protein